MDRQQYLRDHIQKEDGCAPNAQLNKHAKMATSPFVFYRGSAPLFYSDIANGVLAMPTEASALPQVYVMGDCHASNFGFFSEEGSHSSSVIFAPNDFDDACVGYAVWDLVRFCVSLHLCRMHCEHISPDDKKPVVSLANTQEAVDKFLTSYGKSCEHMLLNPTNINTAIDAIAPESKLAKHFRKAQKRTIGGEDFYTKSALAKAAHVNSHGIVSFKAIPEKFAVLKPEKAQMLRHAFEPFMDDSVHDIVGRLGAGTGSVDLARYYFLVGPKSQLPAPDLDEFHIVEVKQQKVASPLRYGLSDHPVNRLNPAPRALSGLAAWAEAARHARDRPRFWGGRTRPQHIALHWRSNHWLEQQRFSDPAGPRAHRGGRAVRQLRIPQRRLHGHPAGG